MIMNCLGIYFYVRYSVSYKKSVIMEAKRATILRRTSEHHEILKRDEDRKASLEYTLGVWGESLILITLGRCGNCPVRG